MRSHSYPTRKSILTLLLMVSFAFMSFGVASATEGDYGKWAHFDQKEPISYPDFKLEFVERSPGAPYPGQTVRRLGDIYKFVAKKGELSASFVWSSGTGDIGPVRFKLGDAIFVAEMVHSEIGGNSPRENSIFISQDAEWREKVYSSQATKSSKK